MEPEDRENKYIKEQDRILKNSVYALLGIGGSLGFGYLYILKQYSPVLSVGIVAFTVLVVVIGMYFAKPEVPRDFQLARIARASGWYTDAPTDMVSSTLYYRHSLFYKHYSNWNKVSSCASVYGEDWLYCEMKVYFDEGMYGYQAMFIMSLEGKFPHLYFDALKGKLHFAPSKKLYTFEGDFNNHFSAYVLTGTPLKALEDITPDVMYALVQASDYSIEIRSDRLYLSGPIDKRHTKKQINDMRQKAAAIRLELHQNL